MESGSFPALTWCISERIAWKCNNLCISMLFMMAFAGDVVRYWEKGCASNEMDPHNCSGAYDTPVCTYTFFLGFKLEDCIQCCEGDQCNTGDPPRAAVTPPNATTCPPPNATTCAPLIAATYAPPRASAGGTLAALSPIVLSLFSFFVFFLLK